MSATRALGLGFAIGPLVVVACSGDGATTSLVSPDTACDEAAKALCSKVQECAPFLVTSVFTDPSQ